MSCVLCDRAVFLTHHAQLFLGCAVHTSLTCVPLAYTRSTIGVDFAVCVLDIAGKCVKVQLWDTAGQERFRAIAQTYFRKADGVLFVYDQTDESSLDSLGLTWIPEARMGSEKDTGMAVMGNKSDVEATEADAYDAKIRCLAKADALAAQLGMVHYQASAKAGTEVNEGFMGFIENLVAKRVEMDAQLEAIEPAKPQRQFRVKGVDLRSDRNALSRWLGPCGSC